jgi:ferric-dicitrate binding protein FerR (iron transport regulator)
MDNQLFLLLTARKLSGEASVEDINELEKFLENDLFREKYELLKAHWENKNSVTTDVDAAFQKVKLKLQNGRDEKEEPKPVADSSRKSKIIKFFLWPARVAAIFLVCLIVAYFINEKTQPGTVPKIASGQFLQTRQTPKAQKLTILLSDGTKVIMNADTRLRFPKEFSGATREVYLTGEAFFDVAHRAHQPFIIHTDKINIKVLGTEFNVKSYPGDSSTETTLIRGLIEVTLNDRPDDRIILKPKEKLIVTGSTERKSFSAIKDISPVHSAELLISNLHYISKSDSAVAETSWINNKLIFQDENFAKLAEELGRKYDVDIQFKNDAVKNYRFTGIFEKESVTEALDALQLTEKFNYKMDGTTINIY